MRPRTNIGICDDHAMIREGLASVINGMPEFKVTLQASNGEVLLEKLKGAKPFPGIILLDISMPVLDGYKTMEILGERYPLLKVMVISLYESDYSVTQMFKLGARGYLEKTRDAKELREALLEIQDGGIYRSKVAAATMSGIRSSMSSEITGREKEFLEYCCTGYSYRVIAEKMGLGERTIHGYRDALFDKLGFRTRAGLVTFALTAGIVLEAKS